MPSYYDDNFGYYEDTDDPETREFYHANQRRSVRKRCRECRRWVRLLPDYDLCNSCAERYERGMDF